MAFHIHRAERTDLLADGLAQLLATPLPDPFAEELVLVPARGVERWLSQRLSHVLGRGDGADGVCAGVSFRSPRSLIAEITGTVDTDPWAPDAMVWPLLDVIDASLDQPWCRTLATHLGHFDDGDEAELRRGRRYAVARRIAGLFASYAMQRPRLPADWLAGDDTDGTGRPLDSDLSWQPELLRALVARVGAQPPHARHEQTLARLVGGPTDLPVRVSLFGHTRLARTEIELLNALATHHDLYLWLPHPSHRLWAELAAEADLSGVPVLRSDDRSHLMARHPLLATLGRDVRELQRTLPVNCATDEIISGAVNPERTPPQTLLGWLQSDIRDNVVRPEGRVLAADDRSVQVHSCHGRYRQIDVLRDVLLGLLADDPTLQPRDILVMCPDIDSYAPLVVAGFGLGELAGESHPAHRLRVRLADRSLVQANPLLGVVAQLLEIADRRVTASEVLNFAESDAVRGRFGFTDDDLEIITSWVRNSGIRWGLDAPHRAPYGLDGFIQNTWRFGLDRILAGVAMSDDSQGWIGRSTLPLDDVDSNKVELAGRLAEFVRRFAVVIDQLNGVRPLEQWLTTLTDAVAQLTRRAGSDAWQTAQLHREFADILGQAQGYGATMMRLNDIRTLLAGRLAGRPTRANFRTGSLTVCTMVPMRSVPHRVVCLVGLDDGVFPRLDIADGDDVLVRRPLTGERDIRSEDRQLLLDAITAAGEKLVITYTGADEHTGRSRPPAVPIAELLDALVLTTPEAVRKRVVVEHPLQPFDIANVTPNALGMPTPFTFDPTALLAARAATGRRRPEHTFPDRPVLEPPRGDVELADLLTFFKHPARGFFRTIDMALPRDVVGLADGIPVELGGLDEWQIGERMLADLLRGQDKKWVLEAEWCRGALPPGRLGWRLARNLCDRAEALATAAARFRDAEPGAVDVDIDLGGGRRLVGTVGPVFGDRLVSVRYNKLDARHLPEPWIQLLALGAAAPERSWTAVCVGRASDAPVLTRILGLPADGALTVLRDVVALYNSGRREPIPLPLKASYAWAQARYRNRDPEYPTRKAWTDKFSGEQDDEAHTRVWGGPPAPLERLLAPPRPGEGVPGESTRLGAYAARFWLPMLAAERRAKGGR